MELLSTTCHALRDRTVCEIATECARIKAAAEPFQGDIDHMKLYYSGDGWETTRVTESFKRKVENAFSNCALRMDQWDKRLETSIPFCRGLQEYSPLAPGWKAAFKDDLDAILLHEEFSSDHVLMRSKIGGTRKIESSDFILPCKDTVLFSHNDVENLRVTTWENLESVCRGIALVIKEDGDDDYDRFCQYAIREFNVRFEYILDALAPFCEE